MPDRRRAWARALFLAAPDRESRAVYADALVGLSSAIEGDRRLRNLLSDPSVSKAVKAEILGAAGEGSVVFGRFCALLVDKGRVSLLAQIARSYEAFRDADEGIARLEVEAARAVAAEVLERVALAWTAYSGAKTTQAHVKVVPALIAGYRLRAGSLRIDYSISGRLERLRRELARPLGKSSGSPEGPAAEA